MATRCKLVIGWTNHMDNWEFQETYIRWYDGYPKAIVPLLKEHKVDLTTMNASAEYDSHKFEKLEYFGDGVSGVDFIYYVDASDYGNIKCTILGFDWEFYKKYGVDNYKVVKEFIL